MGFNLSGLLIRPALADKSILEEALGLELTEQEPGYFEEATRNKYQSPMIDLYSTESGTILLADTPWYEADNGLAQLSQHGPLITFDMSETSMAFYFRHYAHGKAEWEEGIVIDDPVVRMGGGPLQMDENTDVVFETFGTLSKEYLGINFHQIPLEAKTQRFLAKKKSVALRPEEDATATAGLLPAEEKAFGLFEKFEIEGYRNNKKYKVAETSEARVYSFETYLRLQGYDDKNTRTLCDFMKLKEAAYEKWKKERYERLSRDYKKGSGRRKLSLFLFLVAAFGIVYSVFGLLLKPAGINLFRWTTVLQVTGVIFLLLFLLIAWSAFGRKHKKTLFRISDEG